MNVGEIKTSLQALGYGTDTAVQQLQAINDAYRRVSGYKRWPWQETFTAAGSVALGATQVTFVGLLDFLSIDALRINVGTDFRDLDYISPQDYRRYIHVDQLKGAPGSWTYWDQNPWVYPRADRVYTVTMDYIKKPTELAADSDIPILPTTYHDVLKWGAAAYISYRERDWTAYNFASKEFALRLREMAAAVGISQRQDSTRVVSSGVWDRYSVLGPGA